MIGNEINFPKSHDLVVLRNLSSKVDGAFELIKDIVSPLSEYAVQFRYPGEEANRTDAQRAIKYMEEIRKFIRGKLDL